MGDSINTKLLYQKFKEEAKVITLKSTNSSKKLVRWRGKIFNTKSLSSVFDIVKSQIKLK
jgi:hypothetical protein